jgi:hypothetical protein
MYAKSNHGDKDKGKEGLWHNEAKNSIFRRKTAFIFAALSYYLIIVPAFLLNFWYCLNYDMPIPLIVYICCL